MKTVVDVWRWFLNLLCVPKDHDNDGRGDDKLAEAVCALTCELFEHRKLMLSQLATKCDIEKATDAVRLNLASTEARIIKSIKADAGSGDSAGIKKETENLSASTDALQNAVNENK